MELQNIKNNLLQVVSKLNSIQVKEAPVVIALAEAFIILDQTLAGIQNDINTQENKPDETQ